MAKVRILKDADPFKEGQILEVTGRTALGLLLQYGTAELVREPEPDPAPEPEHAPEPEPESAPEPEPDPAPDNAPAPEPKAKKGKK
jgi:hypothetical protein